MPTGFENAVWGSMMDGNFQEVMRVLDFTAEMDCVISRAECKQNRAKAFQNVPQIFAGFYEYLIISLATSYC